MTFQQPQKAHAAWFDDNFLYRKAITVTVASSASDISDLQTLITVDTTGITDKLQTNCEDLRFTNVNGNLLPYYIDTCSDNSATNRIWVLVDSVPKNTTTYTLYMYYGNPSAIAVSDSTNFGNVVGLKSYLTLNDGTGTSLANSAGGNAGSLTVGAGGTQTTSAQVWSNGATGKYGRSTNYDGTDDYSSVAVNFDSAGNTNQTHTSTVEFWFYTTEDLRSVSRGLLSSDSSDSCGDLRIESQANNRLSVGQRCYGFPYVDITNDDFSNTWTHITVTYNNGTQKVYINGTERTLVDTGSQNINWVTVNLGRRNAAGVFLYFNGQIDDVRFFNIARTATQILNDYNNSYPYTNIETAGGGNTTAFASEEQAPSPAAYWKFDDAAGIIAKNSAWKKTNTQTTNLIVNPSFETNLTSWSFAGAGISHARSSEQALFGSWSDKVTWTTAQDHYVEYNLSVSPSTAYVVSMYVYSPDTSSGMRIWEMNGGTPLLSHNSNPTVTNTWQRVTATFTTNASTTNILIRYNPNVDSSSGTGYFDGVQAEQVSSLTNYCDGSLGGNGGHGWSGTAHASTSVCDNGTDGYILNGSWQTPDQCIAGNCLRFNGTSTAVQNVTPISEVKTVSMWVRPTSVSSAALIDLNGTARVTVSSGTISATGFTSPTIYVNGRVSSTLVANEWQYVTVTTGTAISASSVKVGNYSTTYLSGFVDEVKFYTQARSAAQIASDFSSQGSIKGVSADLGFDPQNNQALSNGLVGYWKMNEASWTNDCTATSVTDSSGNSNNGKACPATTGPTGGAAGKFGNAGSFDGSNDYVELGNQAIGSDINSASGVTFSSWVNLSGTPTAGNVYQLAGVIIGDGAGGVSVQVDENRKIVFGGRSQSSDSIQNVTSTSAISTSTWALVTGVMDFKNSTISIYINGSLDKTQSVTFGSTTYAHSWTSGADMFGNFPSQTRYLNGKIDEIRVYNRALTSAEISSLYNFAPGPVTYWDFDNNTGTSASDKSGNGNAATLQGGATWAQGKYGSAASLGTGSQYISSTNPGATQSFTVTGWFNSSGNGSTSFLWETSSGSSAPSIEGTDSGQTFWMNNANQLGTGAMSTGRWYYVTATYDAATSTQRLYVDGVLKGTNTSVAEDDIGTTIYIGSRNGSSFFWKGKVDDFKIYNYARDQKQIIEDMNAGHPAPGSPVGSAVGHWKFDEGYSTTANNSGNGGSTLNGALSGMSSPATATSGWTNSGKFGKALNFDGTNDYVDTSGPSNNASTTAYTIGAWFKVTGGSGSRYIISDANAAHNDANFFVYVNSSNKICMHIYNGGDFNLCGTTTISNDTWYHVAAVQNSPGSSRRLYLNGILENSDSQTSGNFSFTHFHIGTFGIPGGYFPGQIDEVKIYNSALTADQVKLDMNRGQTQVLGALSDNSSYEKNAANQEYCIPGDSTSCAAPVGEWKFDEKQGTSANDTSGNANTGAWSGTGSHWTGGKTGTAGNFNGSDDKVEFGVAKFDSLTTATVELWFYYTGSFAQNSAFFSRFKDSSNRMPIFISSSTQKIAYENFVAGLNRDVVSDSAISANTWYHAAFICGAGGMKMYVNGRLQADTDATTDCFAAIAATASNSIGAHNDTSYFLGKVDRVSIYNYARSAAQIAWDYNRGAPVGHWKFDECQGTTAYDSSLNGNGASNGNTGTITPGAGGQTAVGTCTGSAGTLWKDGATGKYNSSLDFDGTDDYVGIAYQSFLNLGSSFTLAAWIKPNSTDGKPIISTMDVDNGVRTKGYRLSLNQDAANGVNANSLIVQFGKDAWGWNVYSSPTSSITTGSWQHVAVTLSSVDTASPTVKFYINGIERTATFWTGSTKGAIYWGDNANSNRLGSTYTATFPSYNETYFTGQIDDPKIFNYALTATQVKSLYNDGAARFGPVTGSP